MTQILYDGDLASKFDIGNPSLMGWMDRGEQEWNESFKKLPGGLTAFNEKYGEVWQYMGSFFYGVFGWVHDFRHRAFPGSNQRIYARIPAEKGWKPKQEQPWK